MSRMHDVAYVILVTSAVADGWDVATLGALAMSGDTAVAGSWDVIFVDVGGLSGPGIVLSVPVPVAVSVPKNVAVAVAVAMRDCGCISFSIYVLVCLSVLLSLSLSVPHYVLSSVNQTLFQSASHSFIQPINQ